MGRPRRPLLVPLFALVVVAHQDAVAQPATFAKCDSAEPKQQWCLSADGEIRDHWGRCLSRHDCTPQTAGKGTAVFVDNCGVGACAGSQNWKLDADTKHIAAAIHAPCDTHLKAGQAKPIDGDLCNCLDISVANNVAQTFTCKDKDVVGGVEKGYCGEANQEWTLEEDGTFSVPIPPKAMCKAVMDPGCKMPPTGDGCGKVCLVTATPPAGKPPDTVTGHGACIVTAGDLGWQFACLVIGSFALYLCGGVAQGKRKDSALPWREALPHRAFWRNTLGLVVDGVRFTTGKPLGVGGYEPLPVARESQNGTDKRAEALSPPPPPPEDSWEVEGARKRAKESRQQEKGGSPPSRKEREKKGKKEKEKKEKKGKKEMKGRDTESGGGGEGLSLPGVPQTVAETETETERMALQEKRDEQGLHSSQAKIQVVGLNSI